MEESKRREKLEAFLLGQLEELSSALESAQTVNDVICALHSLAMLLFPVDSAAVQGCLDEGHRNQINSVEIPDGVEREEQCCIFYKGASFPAMARILLRNVASKWLAIFPTSARMQIYDSFFLRGSACETLEVLVSALGATGSIEDVELNTVCSNIERLLVLFLLKNEGAYKMALEFRNSNGNEKFAHLFPQKSSSTSVVRTSQILASVPDKARPEAPNDLSSHLFFKNIVLQLLSAAYEIAFQIHERGYGLEEVSDAGTLAFIGETFAKICRRGSTDILVLVSAPMILDHIRSCFSSKFDGRASDQIESRPESLFWFLFLEEMKDLYAVERFSEALLRWLPMQNIEDEEAYWTLWMLFHRTYKVKASTRALFSEKFLLWKVFPVRCLKWVLQFSVFEHHPSADSEVCKRNSQKLLEILQCLICLWSKHDFIQTTSLEQQAYLTAAIGLLLERISKEELESTKDVLHSILEGVSCRLESPDNLVRKMACSIALVFSRIIDPSQPLYLDDNFDDVVDWEFGQKALSSVSLVETPPRNGSKACHELNTSSRHKLCEKKDDKLEHDVHFYDDPDEIIDPAELYSGRFQLQKGFPDDESISGSSEGSCDSSLQPYDLTDDYTDLERKISQLGDAVAALRKPDDPDNVERALHAVEGLVRASPDELPHCAGDLVSSLIRLRCSDISLEGEEESAEERRQKSLVALLVMCPFQSLSVVNKLIYSSNVDLGQRILILDVMTEAAEELAEFKTSEYKTGYSELISPIFEKQPWFLPIGGPMGSGPWKEVSKNSLHLNWSSHSYERELPSKPGPKKGITRRWNLKTSEIQRQGEEPRNRFPLYAATFMLPAMEGFDQKRHGVDLLGRDFLVLGKLIYMLGTCMRCMARHPEASSLAPALLDFLRSREISNHLEAYVRKSVLYATSCILVALHPSYVASALIEGDKEISNGLDWARSWALKIAESDPDLECSSMAMKCLQLHAEMTLQTSRSLQSVDCSSSTSGLVALKTSKILLPFPSRSF